MTSPGLARAQVSVAYYEGGFGSAPTLILELASHAESALTFTIAHNQYSSERPQTRKVGPGLSRKGRHRSAGE